MKRFFAAGILAVFGIAFAAYAADDFWVGKDWKTWSAAECKKMLESSPWAQTKLIENENNAGHLPSVTKDAGNSDVMSGAQNSGVGELDYTFQFRSVPLVREAVVRAAQIDQKYDSMNDAQKKAFDAKMEDVLKTTPPDQIVLHVLYKSNRQGTGDLLNEAWHTLATGNVPKDFFLITDKGAHVLPSSFTFAEGVDNEFDVTFPRFLNGEPIFAAGGKSIKLQFDSPPMGDFGKKRVVVEFKTDKMVMDGKLAL